jgi:hypothetical protein
VSSILCDLVLVKLKLTLWCLRRHPFEAINRKNYHRIKACLAERSTSVFQDEEDEDQLEAEGGVVDCPDSVFSVALLFTNFCAWSFLSARLLVRRWKKHGNWQADPSTLLRESPPLLRPLGLLSLDAYHPGTRGEDIQCTSVIESLTSLVSSVRLALRLLPFADSCYASLSQDYTFFILPGWKHDDSLLRYYSVFQKLTKMIRESLRLRRVFPLLRSVHR